MNRFVEIFNNLVVQSFSQVNNFISQYGPGIAFSLSLILFGWICAVIIRKIITKLLRAFGFDVLSEKTGFKKFLEKGGLKKSPSALIGNIFYWIILLNTLIMAQDALDLKVTSQLIQNIVLYIPNVVVAIIILALGVFISKFAFRFVDRTAHLANIPIHSLLGTIARYAVLGFVVIIILEHLNVSRFVMSESLIVIFGVIPLGFFLIFLVSGKEVMSNVINGRLLSHELKKGDIIECDSLSGRVEAVNAVSTKLVSDKNEEIIIPNTELAKKIIKRISAAAR
ncbi:MAG: mechanosensitive ion channel [Candidatus Omnitrophota bacterium]|nr:MAG: mechanosensitive ion channel [Candidatus Omnitrophota bacterium]